MQDEITTTSQSRKRLERLKELVVDKYIEALEGGGIHFRDMSPIVALLNSNSIIEEKKKSTVEDSIAQRRKKAEERRKNEK